MKKLKSLIVATILSVSAGCSHTTPTIPCETISPEPTKLSIEAEEVECLSEETWEKFVTNDIRLEANNQKLRNILTTYCE